jgi:hypothetical protein
MLSPQPNMECKSDFHVASSRIPRSRIGVDRNLRLRVARASDRKSSLRVRHIPVSTPYIGRRRCGVWLPQSCSVMEDLSREVRHRTFRWPEAAREMVKAYLKDAGSKGSEIGGHVGLSELITNLAAISGNPRSACWRLVRPLGGEVDTQLPAVDETGAPEAPRPDRLSFSRGGCSPATTVANFGSIHAAPAWSERAYGRRLVHQARLG